LKWRGACLLIFIGLTTVLVALSSVAEFLVLREGREGD
jgi:hypothetical protein